ncbi:hypothetical protein [Duganella lactea]|uniref:hypothetical protein n=1 Tax=Duganella lactea TaxID=2692173 RepID=UPI001E296454|nr:hypothetical protein [Duganella lactea]
MRKSSKLVAKCSNNSFRLAVRSIFLKRGTGKLKNRRSASLLAKERIMIEVSYLLAVFTRIPTIGRLSSGCVDVT